MPRLASVVRQQFGPERPVEVVAVAARIVPDNAPLATVLPVERRDWAIIWVGRLGLHQGVPLMVVDHPLRFDQEHVIATSVIPHADDKAGIKVGLIRERNADRERLPLGVRMLLLRLHHWPATLGVIGLGLQVSDQLLQVGEVRLELGRLRRLHRF